MNLQDSPIVSVVIPAYNPPRQLFLDCVGSILEQGFDDFELVIVDDGSESGSAALMDDVASQDERIRLIHQANGGEGAARNSGLAAARGRYVMFVDADDSLPLDWLAYSVELASAENADVVAGKVVQVKSVPEVAECSDSDYRVFDSSSLWLLQRDFLYDTTGLLAGLDYLDPGICSKLIRRECLAGMRFPVGIKISSDQVANHAILRASGRFVLTNRVSYYYVENTESVSHVYQPEAPSIMMNSMSLVRGYLFDRPDIRQAFCYRVLMEICSSIQFAHFSERHPESFGERVSGVRDACSQPLFREALSTMSISELPDAKTKLKARLLKRRMYGAYVILKQVTDAA